LFLLGGGGGEAEGQVTQEQVTQEQLAWTVRPARGGEQSDAPAKPSLRAKKPQEDGARVDAGECKESLLRYSHRPAALGGAHLHAAAPSLLQPGFALELPLADQR
jgi:hypothetical protein